MRRQRVQFRAPIAKLPAVQFLLAEISIAEYTLKAVAAPAVEAILAGKPYVIEAAKGQIYCFQIYLGCCFQLRTDPRRYRFLQNIRSKILPEAEHYSIIQIADYAETKRSLKRYLK